MAKSSKRPRCPICRTPIETMGAARPFCSERCKTIDLGNWLLGDYRVASFEDPYDVAEAMAQQAEAQEREEG